MLLWLTQWLAQDVRAFNVFGYITLRTVLAAMTALAISFVVGPAMIRKLTAYKIGQPVRDDGPAPHLTKAGTPTMGGALILVAICVTTLLYDRSWLRWDLVAALTVWALFVPEGMACATLAGVPPEAGLYAAPLAALAYAIFGTSRHKTVGPSSTVAIMSALVVAQVAAGDPAQFIVLAAALAILVGGLLIIFGLLRFGVLVDFISNPVLTGFIIGLALTIVAGQFDKMLGYSVEDAGFFKELWHFIRDLGMAHLPTVAVGISSLVLLFAIHKFAPKIPAALAVMVLSILASFLFNLEAYGIRIIGYIPAGLPSLGLPSGIGFSDLMLLIPGAAGIALVAFSESVAIARSYATSHGYALEN